MEDRQWSCRDWQAIHDHMPGKPVTLRVTGDCEVANTRYTLRLVRHEPQGINPKDLLLDLLADSEAVGNDVITVRTPEYVEETEFEYDTVTVIGYGTTEVQCVH
jgi:hypothetical protein